MSSNRDYNHIYRWGRLVLQIMQNGLHDGVTVTLLPSVTMSFGNRKMTFVVGLEWLCGSVNFGIANKAFVESEDKRIQRVKDEAAKMGITPRQYALRWGW